MYWNVLARFDMMQIWNGQGHSGHGVDRLAPPLTNVPVVPLALGLLTTTRSTVVAGAARARSRRVGVRVRDLPGGLASSPGVPLQLQHQLAGPGLGVRGLRGACALVRRRGILYFTGAVALGTFGIGVYEGFAFVLVTVFLAVIWRTPTWALAFRTAGIAFASAAAWFVLSRLVTFNVPDDKSGYVGSILGLDGIAADPVGRAVEAVSRMVGILLERWLYFGYTNPLPAVVLAVLFAAAVGAAWSRPRQQRALSFLVLLGLALIPLVAAFLTKVLFQRAMVFLPTIFVIVCALGLPVIRRHLSGRTGWLRHRGRGARHRR